MLRFVALATREIITALWGAVSVSVAKHPGFKQFMAEEYLFSEMHAGFHTWSSMKYSLNWRAGEFRTFIDLTCGQANLTCHVECLTSMCCVWHIHLENWQAPAGTFNMSAGTIQQHSGNSSSWCACSLATLWGEVFDCSSTCVLCSSFFLIEGDWTTSK